MDGERCDRELAPSTPQPAAGAEGVEMFTTPMQQLPVDTHLPVSRQENNDMFEDFSALIMDRMACILEDRMKEASKEAKEASKEQSQEISSILNKHLILLQEKIDERVETGLKQATKGLTVRFKVLDMDRDARWVAQLKQHPSGLDAAGGLRTGLIFKCGDVEEPH